MSAKAAQYIYRSFKARFVDIDVEKLRY